MLNKDHNLYLKDTITDRGSIIITVGIQIVTNFLYVPKYGYCIIIHLQKKPRKLEFNIKKEKGFPPNIIYT